MHYRSESSIVANRLDRTQRVQPAFMRASALTLAATFALFIGRATAQNGLPPALESASPDAGAPPMIQSGGGDLNYFSQDLGTILRLGYRTESYGQDGTGNFEIGTFQIITWDDTAGFFDGQVTLNESDGVGFNLGVGYRWMNFPAYAANSGRMDGVSVWADGTHTDAGNFFPQVGVSYESLGERWDVRANGYIPIGNDEQVGAFEATNQVGFEGNSISNITRATVDRSFYAAELEVARRLGNQRDAWGFAGPYFVANDEEDGAGFRAGMRGYAYPDLLLQVAVSNDDVFDTYATFSAVWFVGRTRTNYQPACSTPDRFREPVMRNDYVVLSHTNRFGGNPLTNPDGTALRVVHVDSDAAPGGTGTAESPFDMLTDVNNAGSQEGDIILAHSTSVFTGESSVILKDDQRLLGEGNNFVHRVATLQRGTIDIPESSPGARALARPQVVGSTSDAIQLANGNEVANFDFQDINGDAISGTGLSGNSNLHDLNVTGGTGFAVSLTDVASTSAVTLNQLTYDGETTSAGGVQLQNFDGTFNGSNSSLTNGATTGAGIQILGDTAGTITFADTVTLNSLDGTAVDINGGAGDLFTGTVTVASDINNDTGRSVSIQGVSNGSISLTGDLTDTGQGILVNSNSGGLILFAGDLDMDTTANTAVTVTDNAGAEIDFPGKVDIVTTSGDGFVATGPASGGGTLTMSAANNTISTDTGQILKITNMTISNSDVRVADVNRTTGAATNAIQLENNTGTGSIDIGTVTDTAGQAGTIAGGTVDAILIDDSANVSVNGVRVNNAAGVAAVNVSKNTNAAMIVSLGNLELNDGARGLTVDNTSASGALNMTINQTAINRSTDRGMNFNNVDIGTITVTGATIDGNNLGATAKGVSINNSNGTFSFDSATQIREWNDDDFEVNGGTGTITFAGDIMNSNAQNAGDLDGNSIHIRNVSGGTITFTADNTVDDTNLGILVSGNTGGTYNFNGDYNLSTGANDAVTVTNNTGATINLGNLDVDTTSGQGLVATGGGTLSVIGTSNTIDRTAGAGAGFALDIENMTIGAVDFERVNAAGGISGVRLVNNTGGTVTIGDTGNAVGQGGTIDGTTDAGVHAENTNVVLNGVTVTNAGNAAGENGVEITHTNATAMTAGLNRLTVTNATPARDGVVIDGAGGSGTFTANVQNLNVNVTGDGFVAQNGVTLTAGGTNTVTSAQGVGLTLNNMAISGTGANFQSVNVTAGTTNGIRMQNVTGGQVAITGTGTTINSGGSLTTAGDAVVLSNVTNVDLTNLQIVDASGAGSQGVNIDHTAAATTAMDVTITNLNLDDSTGAGIDVLTANTNAFALRLLDSDLERNVVMAANGSGHFGLLVDSTDIDTSTSGDVAFTLTTGGTLNSADVTMRNGNNFIAGDASALSITAASAAANTERFLITGSNFTNNSLGSSTANIVSQGATAMDITVQSNQFTNNNAGGSPFDMATNGAASSILLNLGGTGAQKNSANGGAGAFTLHEFAGDFNIFEKNATVVTDTKNNGAVNTDPNDAAFDDSATAPTIPTVP